MLGTDKGRHQEEMREGGVPELLEAVVLKSLKAKDVQDGDEDL
jgi:hypothetical protein